MCVRGGVVATDDSRINTTGPLLIKHQVAILEQPGESCLPDDVYSGGLYGAGCCCSMEITRRPP